MSDCERDDRTIKVPQSVTVSNSSGEQLQATLIDASGQRLKIDHAGARLHVGEVVLLRTNGRRLRAEVLWVTPNRTGLHILASVNDGPVTGD